MPFNFKAYDEKCGGLTPEELQREWQHYTRLITGAATSTSVSGLALPLTLGVSGIGVAMPAPAIHNARKKRAIIERHLARHNEKHVTRKRDVSGSMAVSGTIGVVTLGVSSFGAGSIAVQGAEHGISSIIENGTAVKVATHAALDGAGMAVEHVHTDHLKKRETAEVFKEEGVFQAVDDTKAVEACSRPAYYNQQNLAVESGSSSRSSLSLPSPPPSSYNQAKEAGGYYIQ